MNDESAGPVATLDDIPEHGSARAMVGKTPILLTRRGDEVRALSATCPHGGASLAFGCTCGERVICPLHLAAFDRSSGRVLEPPGHSAVEAWGVRVVGRDVFVERPDSERDGDRAQVRSPPPRPRRLIRGPSSSSAAARREPWPWKPCATKASEVASCSSPRSRGSPLSAPI